nr:RNA-directed DNA polymerase, eukaryota [Tanacetum cinerariifolium]
IKIIIKGQLHLICVKELEAWTPEFKTDTEEDYNSDGESEGTHENDMGIEDPFGIYKLLKRNKDLPAGSSSSSQPTRLFPLGFTPVVEDNNVGSGNSPQPTYGSQKDYFNLDNSKSGNKVNESIVNSEHKHGTKFQASGSILEVMDELIKGLIDLPLEGYSFTWSHKFASKMSKLDRFLISEGLLASFPYISALCLDKHLLDHRPILLRELNVDYGPTPFCFFQSWSSRKGFDKMVKDSWKNYDNMDSNSILNLKNKLHSLKTVIKLWIAEDNKKSNANKQTIMSRLTILDKSFDQERCNDELFLERSNLFNELHDLNKASSLDLAQKPKSGRL